MSKKHKEIYTTLNYIEHFLISALTITGCIPISAFAPLVGVPIGITSSSIGWIIIAIAEKTKSISQ